MDPVDVESRIFLTRKTSIVYEVLYLVHEDWILEQDRTLGSGGRNDSLQRKLKMLAHIRQRKASRSVLARVAMDIDGSMRFAEKPLHRSLKGRIPIQNIDSLTVDGIQTDIAFGEPFLKPVRRIVVEGTVQNKANVILGCESLG